MFSDKRSGIMQCFGLSDNKILSKIFLPIYLVIIYKILNLLKILIEPVRFFIKNNLPFYH